MTLQLLAPLTGVSSGEGICTHCHISGKTHLQNGRNGKKFVAATSMDIL